MSKKYYWIEYITCSLDEQGIVATPEQIRQIARAVEIASENIGMAYPVPENPLIRELEETKKLLQLEIDKVVCKVCYGDGRLTSHGPYHNSNTDCWQCRGKGYI